MHILHLLPTLLLSTPTLAALVNTQFPHLLVPLVAANATTPFGTQTTAEVSNTVFTEVSFDIPGTNAATKCRINFHINTNKRTNAPRELSGVWPYQFNVFALKPPAVIDQSKDSWASHPPAGRWVAMVEVSKEGKANVTAKDFECNKFGTAQFLLKPVGVRQLRFWWFELDYPEAQGGAHGITLEMHT